MKTHSLFLVLLIGLSIGCSKQESGTSPTADSNPAPAAKATEPPAAPKMEGPAVEEILREVGRVYAAATNYTSKGHVDTELDLSSVDTSGKTPAGQMQKLKHTFTLKLSRSGEYAIEWAQFAEASPYTPISKGAVWSDGKDNYLLLTPTSYAKMKDRELALGAATGVSGGSAHTIPSLFFQTGNSILKLEKAKRLPDEKIGAKECYVIDGWVSGAMRIQAWIGKDDYLIQKRKHILGGEMPAPKLSDDEIRESLKAIGQEPTPAAIANMRTMMANMSTMTSKLKGSMTEAHSDIKINQPLSAEDLKFTPPEGATLGEFPGGRAFQSQPK